MGDEYVARLLHVFFEERGDILKCFEIRVLESRRILADEHVSFEGRQRTAISVFVHVTIDETASGYEQNAFSIGRDGRVVQSYVDTHVRTVGGIPSYREPVQLVHRVLLVRSVMDIAARGDQASGTQQNGTGHPLRC